MAEQDTSAKLRHEACHIETDETLEHVAKLMRAGADELDARQADIERLRGEIDHWKEIGGFYNAKYSEAVRERDALRARIADAEWRADVERESRCMFVARLGIGNAPMTANDVLALLSDCDMLAQVDARPIPAPAAHQISSPEIPDDSFDSRAPAAGVPEGWVRVEDGLPRLGEAVLVTMLLSNGKFSEPEKAHRFYSHCVNVSREVWTCAPPTHWMPLPAAPQPGEQREPT